MIQLRYWKWQVLRNLPLALLVFTLVMALGMAAQRLLPQRQTAQSRVVLETPLALHDTPRAARSAQDVQHLQVVMHRLMSASAPADPAPGAIETKITSGRDKPTNLTITAHASTLPLAVERARAATTTAIAISDQLQRDRVEVSLKNLKDLIDKQTAQLATAKDGLSALGDAPDDARLGALRQQASDLENRLKGQAPVAALPDATRVALEKELAKVRVVYSDKHPKVRLLLNRLARLPAATAPKPLQTAPLQARLTTLRAEIAALSDQRDAYQAARSALTDAQNKLEQSKAALIDARLKGERSVARLKMVEDARPLTASREKKRLALLATLMLAATAAGLGAAALRVRLDTRLRRPKDLTSSLGLTPFATIPHLGPQLT